MKWIRQFFILLFVTLLGELLKHWIPMAIPAGIYGLALLFGGLCSGLIRLERVEGAADFLVEIMPLLFIPAGVGLMTKWPELKRLLAPALLAVLVITILVMAVTGRVAQKMMRKGK